MLLKRDQSCLAIIDIQEKLMPLVIEQEKRIERCQWLVRLANELQIPLLVTEQYPNGLGQTISSLLPLLASSTPITKVDFSCYREAQFKELLQALNRNQVILIGIEAHVCILQSALDLKEAGYQVFVVVDAVSSRNEWDYKYGLKRMKQAGIELLTSEMVFFEWIEKAGTPQFKALSKAFL